MKNNNIELDYNGNRYPLDFLPGIGIIYITNIPGKSGVCHHIPNNLTKKPIRIREVNENGNTSFLINEVCIENYIADAIRQKEA